MPIARRSGVHARKRRISGVFTALVDFAERITASQQAFDAAFDLPSDYLHQASEYDAMRSDILGIAGRKRYVLNGIDLNGDFRGRGPGSGYTLNFQEEPYCSKNWNLIAELTPAGFKIIGYENIQITHVVLCASP